ncbi:MAG: hypothetical protein ACRD3W_18970 [Terriglobales bacterium]
MRCDSQIKRSARQRKRGVGCLEVAVASFLMVVLSALGVDVTLMVMACSINDVACRDAARAAAQRNTSAQALKAAQAELSVHSTDGKFISQPTLSSTSSPDFVYNDYSGNPPANRSSYVTVTTAITVKVPAPIFFFGIPFLKSGSLQFRRRYTFPIIKQNFYAS